MNKFSLENRASPEPTGVKGDIPYADSTTSLAWIPHATGGVPKVLTQTDDNLPTWAAGGGGGGGTVTSVGLALPADLLVVSGSPVTAAGTLTGSKANVDAHKFYGGPASGAAAAPTFRVLDADDLDPWVEKFIVERPAGVVDEHNRSFTLSHTPMHERIGVAVDGMVLIGGVDYGWTGTTFRLALTANAPTREIRVWYSYKAKLGTALPSIELLPPDYGTAATWIEQTIPDHGYTSVAYSPDLRMFAAIAPEQISATTLVTSIDGGITWTEATIPITPVNGGWKGMCWGNSKFVAINDTISTNNITTLVSTDGVTWTQHQTAAAGQGLGWEGITWVEDLGLFVAVQHANTGIDTHAATSPDGITWTIRSTPSGTAGYYHTVEWSPSQHLLLAGGTSPGGYLDCMTSPNGITWTASTPPLVSPLTGSLWKIVWVEKLGLWVAAGTFNDGVNSGLVATSPDASTWTIQTGTIFPGGLGAYGCGSVVWSETRQLLIVGAIDDILDGIICSPDAVNWTRSTTPALGVTKCRGIAVAEDINIIVAVNDNVTMRSLS